MQKNNFLLKYLNYLSERISYNNKVIDYIVKKYIYKLLFHKKLSKKSNTLFIHIPKNAGTSVIKSNKEILYFGHLKISELIEYSYFKKEELEALNIFCILRNPYERFYSAYTYFLSDLEKQKNHPYFFYKIQKEILKYKNFEEFILNFNNFKYKNTYAFQAQNIFLSNNYKLHINKIYLNNLEEDYNKVSSSLKLKKIKHENKSKKKLNYNEVYTKKTAKIIYQTYKEDFTLYFPEEYSLFISSLSK